MADLNPPIPTVPCSICGLPTNETQSVIGVAHYKCFAKGTVMTDREELKRLALNVGPDEKQWPFDRIIKLRAFQEKVTPAAILDLLAQLEAREEELQRTMNGWKANVEILRASRDADIERAVRLAFEFNDPSVTTEQVIFAVLSQMKEPTNG